MELQQIDKKIEDCTICGTMVEKFNNNKTVSIGRKKEILIIGEAPANNGWRKSGVAWHDNNNKLLPSGVTLQKLLNLIDYNLEDTYFLEAIKCYPKERKFLKECSNNCRQYMIEQLHIINPHVILTLGDVATKTLLEIKYSKFKTIVGKCYKYLGYDVIPIYHPSPISPQSYKGNKEIFENVIKEKIKTLNLK